MDDTKLTVGPSGAAFTTGSAIEAESTSQCPRYWLAKKNGFRTKIDPLYGAIGELSEVMFKTKHRKTHPDDTIESQVPIEKDLSEHSAIFGYLDMIITKPDGSKVVVEKKAHISSNVRLEVIRKKQVKASHVAQIVTYMIVTDIPKGQIVCDFYELNYDCDKLHQSEGITFDVEIKDRKIYIDGVEYKHMVTDLAKFYKFIDNAVKLDTLPNRPTKPTTSRSSVCTYCPLNNHCDEAEIRKLDKNAFLALVKADEDRLVEYENGRRKEAIIFSPKRKPKEK